MIDNPAIELSSLKAAFDGKGYTIRLFNSTDGSQDCNIALPAFQTEFSIQLGPFEVATYRILDGKAERCEIIM